MLWVFLNDDMIEDKKVKNIKAENITIVYYSGPKTFPLERVARIPSDVQKMLELRPNPQATHATVLVYADRSYQIREYDLCYSRESKPGCTRDELNSVTFSVEDLV